jgi:hypothetical protein
MAVKIRLAWPLLTQWTTMSSAYAEFRIMPRIVEKASIQAGIGLKSSA